MNVFAGKKKNSNSTDDGIGNKDNLNKSQISRTLDNLEDAK